LNNNDLTSIPPEIGQLTNLQDLCLKNNELTYLPPEIGQLTNLQYLYLNNNELMFLPPEIRQLKKLKYFSLCRNKFNKKVDVFYDTIKGIKELLSNESTLYEIHNSDGSEELNITAQYLRSLLDKQTENINTILKNCEKETMRRKSSYTHQMQLDSNVMDELVRRGFTIVDGKTIKW
jgi:hypothetical protein